MRAPELPKRPAAARYVIERAPDRTVTCLAERAGGVLRKLRHIPVHSPTGFEVGYSGSGPADLALALLADVLAGPRKASAYRMPRGRAADVWVLHQRFKVQFLSGLKLAPGDSAELSGAELFRWALEQRERVRGAAAEDALDERRRVGS